jgi:hypothetical protein
MFCGRDNHAEAAAALFSLIASCRLHKVDVEQYLDELLRLLLYWPEHRFIELAPSHWALTRAKLDPKQLELPLCAFTIPRLEHAGAARHRPSRREVTYCV